MIKTDNENNLNLGLLKNDLPFYSESISDILISKIEETYANKGKLGYLSVDIFFPTLMFDSYSRKAVEFSYNEVGIYALPIKGSLLFYLLEENNKTLFDRESGLVFDFINNNDNFIKLRKDNYKELRKSVSEVVDEMFSELSINLNGLNPEKNSSPLINIMENSLSLKYVSLSDEEMEKLFYKHIERISPDKIKDFGYSLDFLTDEFVNKRLYKSIRFDAYPSLIATISALQSFNIVYTIDEFKRDMSHSVVYTVVDEFESYTSNIGKETFISESDALTRLFQTAVLTGNMNEDFIENYINALSDEYDYYFVDKTSHRLIQRKKESIFYVYYQVSEFYNKLR